MPVTPWKEIAGHKCQLCKGWATHFYGGLAICCDCHLGEVGAGGMSQEFLQQMHDAYSKETIDDNAKIDQDFDVEHLF